MPQLCRMARDTLTNSPRALIFDVGGVLVHADPKLIATAIESACGTQPDQERCLRGFAYCSWLAYELGVPQPDVESTVVVEGWAEYLGLHRSLATQAWAAVHSADATLWTRVDAQAVTVLKQLSSVGIPLGIISNATGTLDASLRRKGLRQYFEVVLDSAVVGVAKPDPAIFELMEEQIGVPAARCWYVGDSVHEVSAALDFGYGDAFVFDPYSFFSTTPVSRLGALTQLTELLDASLSENR
jgi:HAD superfamily hydrolase (TIGR01549 family)